METASSIVRYETLVVGLGTYADGLIKGKNELVNADPSMKDLHSLVYCGLTDEESPASKNNNEALLLKFLFELRAGPGTFTPESNIDRAALLKTSLTDDPDKWTFVHWMAALGCVAGLKWLSNLEESDRKALNLKGAVCQVDATGRTPLMLACQYGQLEALGLLLGMPESLSELKEPKTLADTSLRDLAAKSGNLEILKAVIEMENKIKPTYHSCFEKPEDAQKFCKAIQEPDARKPDLWGIKFDRIKLDINRRSLNKSNGQVNVKLAIERIEFTAVILFRDDQKGYDRLLAAIEYLEQWNFSIVIVLVIGEDRRVVFNVRDYFRKRVVNNWGLIELWKRYPKEGESSKKSASVSSGVLSIESHLTRIFLVDRLTNLGNSLEVPEQDEFVVELMRFLAVTLANSTGDDNSNIRSLFRTIYQRDNQYFSTDPEKIKIWLGKSEVVPFHDFLDLLIERLASSASIYSCAGIFNMAMRIGDLECFIELYHGVKAFVYLEDPPGQLHDNDIPQVEVTGIGTATEIAHNILNGFQFRENDRVLLSDPLEGSSGANETALLDHLYSAFDKVLRLNRSDRLVENGVEVKQISLIEQCVTPKHLADPVQETPPKTRFPEKQVLTFKKLEGPLRPVRFFRSLKEFSFERVRHSLRILDEGVEAMKAVHSDSIMPAMVQRNLDRQESFSRKLEQRVKSVLQPDLTLKEIHDRPYAYWHLVPIILEQLKTALKNHYQDKFEGDTQAPGKESSRVPVSDRLYRETVRDAEVFAESMEKLPQPRFMVFAVLWAGFLAFMLIASDVGTGKHFAQFITDFLASMGKATSTPKLLWDFIGAALGMSVVIWLVFLVLRTGVSYRYQALKKKISEYLTERYRVHSESVELRLALGNQAAARRLNTEIDHWDNFLNGMDKRIPAFRKLAEERLKVEREAISNPRSLSRASLLIENEEPKDNRDEGIHEAVALSKGIVPDEVSWGFRGDFIKVSGIFEINSGLKDAEENFSKEDGLGLLSVDQKRELLTAVLEYTPVQERVAKFIENQAGKREVMFPTSDIPQHRLVETCRAFYGTMARTMAEYGLDTRIRTALLREDEDFLGISFINLCMHLDYDEVIQAMNRQERDH